MLSVKPSIRRPVIRTLRYILTALVVLPSIGQAQDVSELRSEYEQSAGTPAALHLLESLVELYELENLTMVTRYGTIGATLAEQFDSLHFAQKFMMRTGVAYANQGILDSAILWFRKARANAVRSNDSANLAASFLLSEYVFSRDGESDSSMFAVVSAIDIYKQLKDSTRIGRALVSMSEILARQQDQEEALAYILQAERIHRSIQDTVELAFTLEQLGYVRLLREEFDLALQAQTEAISLFEQVPDTRPITMLTAYNNLGNIYKNSDQYQQAYESYQTAQEWMNLSPEIFFQASLNFSFCNILVKLERYDEALEKGLSALEVLEGTGMRRDLPELYFRISEAYEGLEQYDKSLDYQRKSSAITDSLFEEDSDRRILQLQTEYESKEKEAQIQQLKVEGQQRTWLLIAALGFALLLSLFVGFLFVTNQQRRATNDLLKGQKKEIEEKSAQNELLLKEIHHRVKNNLQTISSLLYLQSAHIKDDEVREAFTAGQHRVESMALIHQKLYQRETLASVEMKEYVQNLSQSLFLTFGIEPDRLSLVLDMKELELDVDRAVPLGLIISELITNSLKYAFPEGRSGTITIKLEHSPDLLFLQVEDNGVGIGNQRSGTSFGSQLIELLTRQLGGELQQIRGQSGKGYCTTIRIPA